MNEDYIKRWNEVVQPEDLVYYLGDFSMALRPVELFTSKLNGKKTLISGNHDWVHCSHKKSSSKEKQAVMMDLYKSYGWQEIYESLYLDPLKGNLFKLCHLPYKDGDSGVHSEGKRYSNLYPEDAGTILLCGHVHQHWKTRVTSKGTLMINVGVDVWDGYPVSIDQIEALVKEHLNENLPSV
jgi:calcineurin-like phosphoesterase family protein